MRPFLVVAVVVLAGTAVAFLEAACGGEVEAGYTGPYPSAAAQEALRSLAGRSFPGEPFGVGAALAVDRFGSVPEEPASGPQILVRVEGGAERFAIPLTTDGDAADFVERVTGEAPVNFGGATSAAYRAAVGLDEP